MSFKRELFRTSVMLTVLYGSKVWATIKKVCVLVAVAKRRTERFVTETNLVNMKANEWLREVTKLGEIE